MPRRRPTPRRLLVTGLVPKFTFLVGALLTTFGLAHAVVSILAQQQTIEQQLRPRAEAMAATLAAIAASSRLGGRQPQELGQLIERLLRQDDLLYIAIFDWKGSLIAGSASSTQRQRRLVDDRLSRQARLRGDQIWQTADGELHLAMPIGFLPGQLGAVRIGLDLAGPASHIAEMRRRDTLLIVFLVAGGVATSLLLIRRITRPLARLIETTDAVNEGRLDGGISIRTHDELELLADSFNRMLDRLDATTVSRDYLTHILQSMSEALVVLSIDGRIMLANHAMSRLVGRSEDELGGMLFERMLDAGRPGTGPGRDLLGRLRREGSLDQVETYYVDRGGRPVAVLVSGALMWESDGTLRGMICIAQDDRERRRQQEQVRRLAYFDSITGLPNRVHFHLALERALASAMRRKNKLAVLFLDLDDFKRINDTLGHATGDRLLLRFAERLQGSLRASDAVARLSAADGSTVARLGGDEFTVLLSHIESRSDAVRVAERILEALAPPFDLNGHEVVVDGSIGIAIFPDDARDPQTLLMHADAAMYQAKAHGRGGFQIYRDGLQDRSLERLTMEGELRKAQRRDQLRLVFQPELDLASDTVVAAEALLRWQHPERGSIPPDEFIPLAEQAGLIGPIGEWVLETSCLEARTWLERGLGEIRVAVNISRRQLWRPDFVDRVAETLARVGLPARLLELEITESTAMADPDAIIDTLSQLRTMGVQLTMDDFGTGYSSLNYLKEFPLDRIKIDRSFVRDVARNADDAEIVHAIIALAHQLSFSVVAEGVESDGQLALLAFHQCDQVQGFLLSPPLATEDFALWLEARRGMGQRHARPA